MFQFNNRRILDRVRSSGRLARAATGLDDEFSKHMAGSCLILVFLHQATLFWWDSAMLPAAL